MPSVRVISKKAVTLPDGQIVEGYIDLPADEESTDTYNLFFLGWVLGRDSPAVSVDLFCDGTKLVSMPVALPRPDVHRKYPHLGHSQVVGFEARVNALCLPSNCSFSFVAVLKNGVRAEFARLATELGPIETAYSPRLGPLLVNSMGRTGSTFCMKILSGHPAVTMFRAYPYECDAAAYWMHMLRVLAGDTTRDRSRDRRKFVAEPRSIGAHPFFFDTAKKEGYDLNGWFGARYSSDAAAFCQRSIDGFYQRIAETNGDSRAVRFCEKSYPNPIFFLFGRLYPAAKEIVLVRDFRDVVCSILEFNKKRGFEAFGRENCGSDEDYVKNKIRSGALKFLKRWQSPSGNTLRLRYEDLVRDTPANAGAAACLHRPRRGHDRSGGLAEKVRCRRPGTARPQNFGNRHRLDRPLAQRLAAGFEKLVQPAPGRRSGTVRVRGLNRASWCLCACFFPTCRWAM